MSRQDPQTHIRLPAGLKARVELAASENRRSVTAELISRIEHSFTNPAPASSPSQVISSLGVRVEGHRVFISEALAVDCIKSVILRGLLDMEKRP